MTKPKLLMVCPPDHYLLRNLDAIRNDAEIHIGGTVRDLEPFAADESIIVYKGFLPKIKKNS